MTKYCFLEPLDVLFLRGNKLFGDPGSFGQSLVPPWPSVAAGAVRSHLLASERIDFADFATGKMPHPALGSPSQPGPFTLVSFHLARRIAGKPAPTPLEALYPLPADLIVTRGDADTLVIERLRPTTLAPGLLTSAPLAKVPVLAQTTRRKAVTGLWLSQAGWTRYLAGEMPDPSQLVESCDLWQLDPRIGIGLDRTTGRADDGKLFSTQAVAFRPNVGFIVGVKGAELPMAGVLRFGGDGRGAAIREGLFAPPQPDLQAVAQSRRCRWVLTTPGLFSDGWQPEGMNTDGTFRLGDVRARLVCAAVPRAEVVSGWDLAQWQPKPALRAAPSGSVYWLEDLEATPEALRKLAERGLWTDAEYASSTRRAEGFNRVAIAA